MHGLNNPRHEPVFVVVQKSVENGTGLCQKSANLGKRQINRDEEKENSTGWSQENHPAR